MTDVNDWSDPTYDGHEPDPSDYEERRAEEEYWEHCDDAHGGKKCDCPQPEWPTAGVVYSDEPPF